MRTMRRAHWLAFFGTVILAWAVLFAMAVSARLAPGYDADLLAAICGATPGSAGPGSAVAMWLLMSGAMMAPTAVPAFRTYDDLSHAAPTSFAWLLGGFLAVWGEFAVLAGLGQYALFRAGLVDGLGQSRSALFAAALLAGAGAYQFSALKAACVARCRAPLAFFVEHWAEGPWRNGLRLGADCLGCCWALMLLGFVGGVMSLGFMGLALVLMVLEKLPEIGRRVTRPLGAALIVAAAMEAVSAVIS